MAERRKPSDAFLVELCSRARQHEDVYVPVIEIAQAVGLDDTQTGAVVESLGVRDYIQLSNAAGTDEVALTPEGLAAALEDARAAA